MGVVGVAHAHRASHLRSAFPCLLAWLRREEEAHRDAGQGVMQACRGGH